MLTSGQKIGDNEYVQVDRDYDQVLWGMSKWYDVCPRSVCSWEYVIGGRVTVSLFLTEALGI